MSIIKGSLGGVFVSKFILREKSHRSKPTEKIYIKKYSIIHNKLITSINKTHTQNYHMKIFIKRNNQIPNTWTNTPILSITFTKTPPHPHFKTLITKHNKGTLRTDHPVQNHDLRTSSCNHYQSRQRPSAGSHASSNYHRDL